MQSHRGTVFVIEDDPSLNQAVGRLLEAAGYDARLFPSAEALLEDATVGEAQCFVVDVHLPGMSGFALQRHLASSGLHAPLILITAHDDSAHRKLAEEIGATYLRKPFSSTSLIQVVEHALAARKPTIDHEVQGLDR